VHEKELGFTHDTYWQWAINTDSKDKTMIGRTFKPDTGLFKDHWLLIMAVPTWRPFKHQERDVEYQLEGLSFIVIDPIGIAQRYARDVRSGETGYAWIIDGKGLFLSHYEETFVGEDSFTVRSKRNLHISYTRVNEIVRKHMQKGEEGTNWYISGWHRGITGETKKLIAYSPILLSRTRKTGTVNLWSVGVTAPVSEVYGIIESLIIRQWLIVGLFQLVVFCCLAVAIYFSLRWSQILQAEVVNSTANLRQSEEALRHERDKVKESMQRLIETQKMLIRSERLAAIGEAAAYLSHEIKNPLVNIGGFAGQIERSLSGDDKNIRKLQIIREEIRRLELLLTDVRDFTRPTTLARELNDINSCIEATVAFLEDDLKTMGIHCEQSLDHALPPIWFDPQQMKQVLINLIKNAAEAMPGGKITILSWRDGDWIKVSIRDTGAGISTDTIEKIFEPFFTTKRKGTGLGLAVCRKIIEDHGGAISVESEEGKGTKFTFSLPVNHTEEPSTLNNQNKTEG
jgi:signal transduction histidine kinase